MPPEARPHIGEKKMEIKIDAMDFIQQADAMNLARDQLPFRDVACHEQGGW
jgi:hypothetical protein